MTWLWYAIAGFIWGGWLGQREAAHLGMGVGWYGLPIGAILGAAIGVGIGLLPELLSFAAITLLYLLTYWLETHE
jgi:hypothetical protein